MEALARTMRQENETKRLQIGKEEVKFAPLSDDRNKKTLLRDYWNDRRVL